MIKENLLLGYNFFNFSYRYIMRKRKDERLKRKVKTVHIRKNEKYIMMGTTMTTMIILLKMVKSSSTDMKLIH